jgi:hypothetical protein
MGTQIEIVYREAAKAGVKSLVPARRVQRTNQGRTVLFESPFNSVSTVSRGHPSLVYLTNTEHVYFSFNVSGIQADIDNYYKKLLHFEEGVNIFRCLRISSQSFPYANTV